MCWVKKRLGTSFQNWRHWNPSAACHVHWSCPNIRTSAQPWVPTTRSTCMGHNCRTCQQKPDRDMPYMCTIYIYLYICIYIYIDRCRDSSFIQQFLVCSVEFYKGVDGAPNHLSPGMGHICLGLSGAAWCCLGLPDVT